MEKPAMTPEQALKLLNAGHIDARQFNQLTGQLPPDTKKDDTVPAMLSAGEVVVPRSVVSKGDKAVAEFVSKLHPQKMADGGIPQVPYNLQQPGPVDYTDPTSELAIAQGGAPVPSATPGPSPLDTTEAANYTAPPADAPTAGPQSFTPSAPQTNQQTQSPFGGFSLGLAPTAVQVQQGIPMTAADQANWDKGAKDQLAATKAQGALQVQLAGAQADSDRQVAAIAQQRQSEIQNQQAAYSSQMQQRMTDLDSGISDLKNTRIDPNHYWANVSTEGKIGAAIAVGLGALGAGFTGGPNYALDIINGAIKRDTEAQVANASIKERALGYQKDAIQAARQKFVDEDTYSLALNNAKLEKVKADVMASLPNYRSDMAKANAQQLVGGIEQKMAANNQEMRQRTQDHVTTQMSLMPMINGRPVNYKPENVVTLPDNSQAYVPDAKQAEALKDTLPKYSSLKGDLRELQGLYAKFGTQLWGSPAATRAKQLSADIRSSFYGFKDINRFTDTENEMAVEDLLSDKPTSVLNVFKTPAQLQGLNRIVDRHLQSKLQSAGVRWTSPSEVFSNAMAAPNQRN